MRKYCGAFVNLLVAGGGIFLLLFVIPGLTAYFAPFVIGWLIAEFASPIVNILEKKLKIKRKAGSAFVIIAVIGLIVFIAYLCAARLGRELLDFAQAAPKMLENTRREINQIADKLMETLAFLPESVRWEVYDINRELDEFFKEIVVGMRTPMLSAMGRLAKYLPTLMMGGIMTLLSAYFFVADRAEIRTWVQSKMSQQTKKGYRLLQGSLKKAVGGYFKAQLRIEIWIYVLLVAGLGMLRVQYVWLIAFGIAFLDFLPLFGMGTVMIPWALIKFFDGKYKMAAGLFIVWLLGQAFRQLIQPKIMGETTGLKPLPTLLLLYIGYRSGGVPGMIVAIPLGMIVLSMYEEGLFDTTIESAQILAEGIRGLGDNIKEKGD